ncbi:hypothetical protein NK553_04595 [Pseudomonas sp. ZM23]|uniref:Uncharacterized protein n=1 Tax=Pseudomonas triclosanedens TaxID=2961893 RepID=A0ABY6ZXH6_9PSED|nr:hypothetical protein [Pseudomonas triclosanedens]MCP8463222.1 hypothetical protein [Pseudomonas triclosanedens]MCP8469719.1 hypothetical protein [Pseudomonas triclosanedens]MCP8474023.1 hypothetical protein [Pseudomonas triclosanedens]WAI48579.1 hypothetical protein OU419_22900 [Pseudomonas triclosanedens]
MTLEQLLDRKKASRIFFVAVLLLVIVLLGVRYFVIPRFAPTLSQGGLPLIAKILEDASTTMVVTVLIAAFLKWVDPFRSKVLGLAMVDPWEVKTYFADALNSSNKWSFAGGCGRYFRSAVLREMQKRARSSSTSKSVEAIILNPENTLLCERHARYRSGTLRGEREGNWTTERVKQELLATVLISKRVASTATLLDVDIYVVDHFSSFRVDLAETCAIETREDPTAPALKCDSGSYYYTALNNEYRLLREQSRPIVGGEAECAAVSDLASLKTALSAVGLSGHGLSDEDLAPVLTLLRKPGTPYE